MTAEIPTNRHYDTTEFPFRTYFSLRPLNEKFWDKFDSNATYISKDLGLKIRAELTKAPELTGHIDNPSVLEKHKELVDVLMGAVFPPAMVNENFCAN